MCAEWLFLPCIFSERPKGVDTWCRTGGLLSTNSILNKRPPNTVIFQRGEYTKPMAFYGWFFKGGSTQNRWVLMGDFSQGGVHKTDGFWWVIFQRGEYMKPMSSWNIFLFLLKIKRPGRLFRQIQYIMLFLMKLHYYNEFLFISYVKRRNWFVKCTNHFQIRCMFFWKKIFSCADIFFAQFIFFPSRLNVIAKLLMLLRRAIGAW